MPWAIISPKSPLRVVPFFRGVLVADSGAGVCQTHGVGDVGAASRQRKGGDVGGCDLERPPEDGQLPIARQLGGSCCPELGAELGRHSGLGVRGVVVVLVVAGMVLLVSVVSRMVPRLR